VVNQAETVRGEAGGQSFRAPERGQARGGCFAPEKAPALRASNGTRWDARKEPTLSGRPFRFLLAALALAVRATPVLAAVSLAAVTVAGVEEASVSDFVSVVVAVGVGVHVSIKHYRG
jgi:hypothetical protein